MKFLQIITRVGQFEKITCFELIDRTWQSLYQMVLILDQRISLTLFYIQPIHEFWANIENFLGYVQCSPSTQSSIFKGHLKKNHLFDTIEIRYRKVNETSSTLCNLSLVICDVCLNSLEGSIYQNIWDGSRQLQVEHFVAKS